MLFFKKIQKNKMSLFYLACFIFIFILSTNMNYNADEYNYSFITWSENRITSINDILQSQKLLYLSWTGRILVHFLIQLFLFIPPYFYAFFNAFTFTFFIYLILYLSNIKNTNLEIISSFSLVFLLIPVFGETCIWISGSINYLWPSTLFLLLLKLLKDSKVKLPLIMVIAFLAGLTQEIVLIGGFIYLGYELLINKFNKKYLLTFISFLIGGLILISSPGNFIRASSATIITKTKICQTILGCAIFIFAFTANFFNYFKNSLKFFKASKITTIIKFVSLLLFILSLGGIFTQKAPASTGVLLLIYEYKFIIPIFIIYIFLMSKSIEQETEYTIILESINYIAIGFTAALAMGVMPEFPTRSLFLASALMLIGVLKLYSELKFSKLLVINTICLPLTFIIILFSLNYYIFNLREWKANFNNHLLSNRDTNLVTVEIQPKVPFIIKNYYRCEPSQITTSPHSITNYYCAKYYNVENIIGVKRDYVTIKIEKDGLDLSNIAFKYINKNRDIITAFPDKTLIEPSKSDLALGEAYFSIPVDAENLEFINNSLIAITDEDIKTYTLN